MNIIKLQKTAVIYLIICLSLIICVLYELDYIFPLSVSVSLFTTSVCYGLFKVKASRLPLLTRMLIILYSLPFMHSFEYLWSDDIYNREILWGLTSNFYNKDIEIIKRMTMVGMIGVAGLVAGFLAVKTFARPVKILNSNPAGLKLPAFGFIAFLSLFFSWINAPAETLLTAAYTQSESLITGAGVNFNAAWVISYVLAALLMIDVLLEHNDRIKYKKKILALVTMSIIVIWFQFMRGDRECIGLVFALFALYLLNSKSLNIKRHIVLMIAAAVVFISAQAVGTIRSIAVDSDVGEILNSDVTLKAGTWSAALMSPLSVVGDFYHKEMEPKFGRTYLDYLLSLPPGILTQMLGMERPVEGTSGPAWEMRYGLGGTHAMVVPFMNFKSYGVFVVLLLYGIFVAALERRVQFSASVKLQLLYASLFIISPFWFWYGEMNLVRAIMAYYIIWWMYRILPKRKQYTALRL